MDTKEPNNTITWKEIYKNAQEGDCIKGELYYGFRNERNDFVTLRYSKKDKDFVIPNYSEDYDRVREKGDWIKDRGYYDKFIKNITNETYEIAGKRKDATNLVYEIETMQQKVLSKISAFCMRRNYCYRIQDMGEYFLVKINILSLSKPEKILREKDFEKFIEELNNEKLIFIEKRPYDCFGSERDNNDTSEFLRINDINEDKI